MSFATSCKIKNEKYNLIVKSFPLNIELKGSTIKTTVNILNPKGIGISGDKVLIYDNVQKDLFKVFKLPNLEHIYSWGNMGRGPDEFTFIDDNYIRCFDNELELVDHGTLKRFVVNSNCLVIKSTVELPTLQNPINNMQKINDSFYIANNIFEDVEYEHILIDVKSNRITNKFGKYPDDGLNIKKGIDNYQIYYKSNISNPDREKFIVFYMYFNKIKIYNGHGNIEKIIILEDKEIDKYKIEHRDDNPLYFGIPYATENYFYVLRLNQTENEIVGNIDNFKPELLIWDWDGNPIANFKLDKPIIRFAVSEKHKKLYATSVMEEDEIYTFDLMDISFD